MDFLFFDIECCDGNHMCSFGYVITDENFNVLEKKDIIMNPKAKFKLGRTGFNPFIELAYSEDEFKKEPQFLHFYTTIKELFDCPNRLVFGHSVDSDIKYLQIACQRYKKSLITIIAYDTQKIYSWFKGENNQCSLSAIIGDLNIDVSDIKQHKSDDDAHLTMLVVKEICHRKELNILDLVRYCRNSRVDSNKVYFHKNKDGMAYSTDKCDNKNNEKLTAMELAFQKAKNT